MALTVSTIGAAATTTAATSLSITASGVVQAGGQIYLAVCGNTNGFDNVIDDAGNVYELRAGSQSGVAVILYQAANNLRLGNNGKISISLASGVAFDARMAAFSVSGLTSGAIVNSSAGQGSDALPSVAIDNVPLNNFIVGIVGVLAPSSAGFTQDPNYSSPGNLNVQTTTVVSVYAGFKQVTVAGTQIYAPTLGAPHIWSALMLSLTP